MATTSTPNAIIKVELLYILIICLCPAVISTNHVIHHGEALIIAMSIPTMQASEIQLYRFSSPIALTILYICIYISI